MKKEIKKVGKETKKFERMTCEELQQLSNKYHINFVFHRGKIIIYHGGVTKKWKQAKLYKGIFPL